MPAPNTLVAAIVFAVAGGIFGAYVVPELETAPQETEAVE